MTEVNVRLHGVQKIFPGGVEAVAAMDLELSPGRVTALLGPTGCGKSTLLATDRRGRDAHRRFDRDRAGAENRLLLSGASAPALAQRAEKRGTAT